MSGFDTSGEVENPAWRTPVPTSSQRLVRWSDLSPFVQGYIEAAANSNSHLRSTEGDAVTNWRFSDLHPAALARIMEDCERFKELYGEFFTQEGGWGFWKGRQLGNHSKHFPPLRLAFSNDGKVIIEGEGQ